MSDRIPLFMLDPTGAADGEGPVYDAATDSFVLAPAGGASATHVRERLTAAAGDDTLTLGAVPVPNSVVLWLNGSLLWEGAEYTLASSTKAVFSTALAGSDEVSIWYQTTVASPGASALSAAASLLAPLLAEMNADSPWGLWACDEASGPTLADSSGHSRPLTVTGSPTYAAAGPATGVPSISWPISSPSEHYAKTAATLTQSAVTATAWVYLSANPAAKTGIVTCANAYGGTTQDKQLSIETDGRVAWSVYDGSTKTIYSTALPLGTWCHVVGSVGTAGIKIRINKATAATGTAVSSYTGAQSVFVHGGGAGWTDSGPVRIAVPSVYTTQLSDARTDAHCDVLA